MKKGEELGLTIFKTAETNRSENKTLDTIVHNINDIAFQFNKRYINYEIGHMIMQQIAEIGEQVNSVEHKNRKTIALFNGKKNQILEYLRNAYRTLRNYVDDYDATDDVQHTIQTAKFQVWNYLKAKENGKLCTDTNCIIKMLEDNKLLYDKMIMRYEDEINLNSFFKMQEELIELLNSKYRLK